MDGGGPGVLSAVEDLVRRMADYMRTHGLPSPKFHVRTDGGSRVILESLKEPTFPRRLVCVFTPPTYTVMVEGLVVVYDTFNANDKSHERILRTLFDVILQYVIND